jgi:uncharacterized protein with GYD domain
MPIYVGLTSWTDQGVKNYRDTVARADSFRDMVRQAGGQVRELLWTLGEYDLVSVMEVPDDETHVALALQLSALGNIRTKTMRAMSADEMTSVIGRTS